MTKRKVPPVAPVGDLQLNSQHGGPQLVRHNPGRIRFDKERRRLFLDALTLCCNIGMSAKHAGVHVGTVYAARARDPIFGEQWREALGMGLERLEAMVVEHGGAGLPLEAEDMPDLAANSLSVAFGNFRLGYLIAERSETAILSFESGDSMTGRFLVTRLDYAGEFSGERSYTLTLESSGAVTPS